MNTWRLSIIILFLLCVSQFASAADVGDLSLQLEQFKDYISDDSSDKAIDLYDQIIIDFSDSPLISSVVYDIAETFRNNKKYEQSIEVYKDVLSNWPDKDQAISAQRGLIVSTIALDKMTEAEAETDKLIQQYAGNAKLCAEITEVGGAYHWFKKYDQADAINEYVIAHFPDSEPAFWARMNIATSKIATGNYSDAAVNVNRLIADHSDDARMNEALGCIADAYNNAKNYEEAKKVFADIISKNLAESVTDEAGFILDKIEIFESFERGEADSVVMAANELVTKYKGNPGLGWALSRQLAEDRFYAKAFDYIRAGDIDKANDYFSKAIAIWQKVLGEDVDFASEEPYARVWIANSYAKMGDYYSSIRSYQGLLDNCKDCKFADIAVFTIGRNYEKMLQASVIDKKTAEKNIRHAYEKLLADYPDSKYAGLASRWLKRNR